MKRPDERRTGSGSAPMRTWVGRVAQSALRSASLLVPEPARAGWLREWSAEVWHREGQGSEWPAATRAWKLLGPVPGAFVHALSLRITAVSLESIRQDVAFALRSFRRAPGHAAVMLTTLGLGVGALVTTLSVVHGALRHPYPYGDAERIGVLGTATPDRPGQLLPLAYPEIADVLALGPFQAVTGYDWEPFNVRAGDRTEWMGAGVVSPAIFETIGLQPMLGRGLRPSDAVPGAAPVVVIGEALWRRSFGGSDDAVGRTLSMDGRPHEIVGVAPAALDLPEGAEAWVPLIPGGSAETRRSHWLGGLVRLAPNSTWDEGRAALQTLGARLAEAYPGDYDDRTFTVVELREYRAGEARSALLALALTVGLVLLVVAANLLTLTGARSMNRAPEFMTRRALGAGRGRIRGQLVVEGLVLGLGAGTVGLALASWVLPAIAQWVPERPDWFVPRIDPGIAVACLAASAAIGAVATAAPLLRSGLERAPSLTARPPGPSRSREVLLFAEVAFTTVLLLGAVALVTSLARLTSVDPGFEATGRLTGTLQLPAGRYADDESVLTFAEALERTLEARPGVAEVGLVTRLPFRSGINTVMWWEDGQGENAFRENPQAELNSVTPGYFEAMGIDRLQGPGLAVTDGLETSDVVVVSEAFANGYFGHRDPLGSRISFSYPPRYAEIVGVVADVKHEGLEQEYRYQIYAPFGQRPTQRLSFVVHGSVSAASLTPTVREVIRELDPDLAISGLSLIEDVVRSSVWRLRFLTRLVWACGLFAMLLAAVGVAGIVAQAVTGRTREIGVRLALGARPSTVVSLVCGRTGLITTTGLFCGVLAAWAFGGLTRMSLYGVDGHDPWLYVPVVVGFGLVGLLSAWLPARHAARLDPVRALRAE